MNLKEIIELIQIDFDSMENREPVYQESLNMFEDGDEKTAHLKAEMWLSKQPPKKFYLGYDGNVYPKIISKRHWVR